MNYLTTHTSLSSIRRGFTPSFVNYKKRCTRYASDKVYQLLARGRWFSPGTPASSITKTGRHDIAEILLKVVLKHQKSKIKKINQSKTLIPGNYELNFDYYGFQYFSTQILKLKDCPLSKLLDCSFKKVNISMTQFNRQLIVIKRSCPLKINRRTSVSKHN